MQNKKLKKIVEVIKKRVPKKYYEKFSKKRVILGLGVVVALAALYLYKGLFVAAFVNGMPISRISVIAELEKQYGKQALDSLIGEALIYQEARNQNVSVAKEEIDNLIAEIEENYKEQGGIDQVLLLRGMTRDDLNKEVETQLLIEKMFAEKVSVTDEEVDEYIKANQDIFPEDISPEEIRKSVEEQLKQQKLGEEFQTWFAGIEQEAKIEYFVEY